LGIAKNGKKGYYAFYWDKDFTSNEIELSNGNKRLKTEGIVDKQYLFAIGSHPAFFKIK